MAKSFPRRLISRNAQDALAAMVDIAIFALATVGTYFAQMWDRPRSAVLVYLVGVTLIGARSGLAWGVTAAVTASLIYNLFLSEPLFHFSASSAEELIPLIAFNVTAVLTGAMAGRLKDSVKLARAAEAKSAYLLRLSDELQRAIRIMDVLRIARGSLPFQRVRDVEIYLIREDGVYSAAGESGPFDTDGLVAEQIGGGASGRRPIHMLKGSGGEIGFVRFTLDDSPAGDQGVPDLQGIAIILGLAVDRCLLLERLSESEALQKSEELKTAILSSVSHDLRTPLTAIEAAATSLKAFDSSLSPRNRAEMLATISEQCRKLNRYTANLLDMGRIQAGIPSVLFTEVDVVEMLGVVLASVRETYPGQEIEKQIGLDSAVVRANPAMLEQVIFNLLENAILHGASERPIYLRLMRVGGACMLEIIDFGPGIPANEQALVFEKFYRSRAAAHRDGNGLGLHIANGFTQAFGGTVAIVSPHFEGVGTKIELTLPLAEMAFDHVEALQ